MQNLNNQQLSNENLNQEDLDHEKQFECGNDAEKSAVSDRKREANRQNAQKSTGPRTERGKSHSAGNAITHGLYAKNANFVLSQESKEQFSDLCLRFHFDLMPIGAVE